MAFCKIAVVCFAFAALVRAQTESGAAGGSASTGGESGSQGIGPSGVGGNGLGGEGGGFGGGFGGRGFGGRGFGGKHAHGFGFGGHGGGFGLRGLSFFDELDESTKQKFRDIMFDHSLSREEKKTKINQLAESVLNPTQLAEFKQKAAEREQKMAQFKEEMDKKIAALSPNARKAAEQIRALWQDKSGGPGGWQNKLSQMEQIKSTLTDAEKKELEDLWHGFGFGHGGGMLRRLSFYKDLDDATKEKFAAIMRNRTMNRQEKMNQISQLAQTVLTPTQLAEFKEQQEKMQQRMQQWKEKMDAKIAAMTPNARKAAEQIRALWEDQTLDWKTKRTQIQAIKAGLTDSERTELQGLHGGKHGHGRHGGRMGMGGFGGGMGGGMGGENGAAGLGGEGGSSVPAGSVGTVSPLPAAGSTGGETAGLSGSTTGESLPPPLAPAMSAGPVGGLAGEDGEDTAAGAADV